MPMDLSLQVLKVIQDYLLDWKQSTKIGSSYSTWKKIISSIPLPLTLGLLDILLCDLFLEYEGCSFPNCTDNTTPYVVANNTMELVQNLTNIIQKLFTCFASNQNQSKSWYISLIAKHTKGSKHPNSYTL